MCTRYINQPVSLVAIQTLRLISPIPFLDFNDLNSTMSWFIVLRCAFFRDKPSGSNADQVFDKIPQWTPTIVVMFLWLLSSPTLFTTHKSSITMSKLKQRLHSCSLFFYIPHYVFATFLKQTILSFKLCRCYNLSIADAEFIKLP